MKKFLMFFLGFFFLTSTYGMEDQEYKEKHLELMKQSLINLHPSENIDFTKTDMVFVAAEHGEFGILKSIILHSPTERINLIDPLVKENIFHFIAEAKYFAHVYQKRQKEKLSEATGMINFLVSKGLDINLPNELDQTPLDILEEKNEDWAIGELKKSFRNKGAKTFKELN
jgi:hypothetical protein